ncbi:MAG: AAA family ATPase [Flexilinea sp.]|nr:AAA family ATPase [Flexilinea sp.]
MGQYINPGNAGFSEIVQTNYVDKTGLIRLINDTAGTVGKLTCISRPRRFGKSYAAKMLTAYYDCSCDSHALFDDKEIAASADYKKHLNQYHVICFDVTGFISAAKREGKPLQRIPGIIADTLRAELIQMDPDLSGEKSFTDCVLRYVEKSGCQFVFIIDEWDALIREAKDDRETQKAWLSLLREWFKNSTFTPKAVAAAYMTGILPIKKDGSQSAISDFREYSILYPGKFAEYTGFTNREVLELCGKYEMSYDEIKAWYDGYEISDFGDIYNPYSVMRAIEEKKCRSYWQKTSSAESLMSFINMDFDGLREVITRLIAGEEIEVNTDYFENDFVTFKSRDDVLTLLIHLGYLTFLENEQTVRIPNEEVRIEFRNILRGIDANPKWLELIQKSRKLLDDTIHGNEKAVSEAIAAIRETEYAPTFYNNEQALRYVIKFAYIAGIDQYLKVEELPSVTGIADVVYIPKRRSLLPPLVVELKWNRSAGGAIEQIKEKNYPAVLKDYGGDIVLAGINYDSQSKEHACKIETIRI